ncbi:MAG: SHOCT domain-containing protein [Acidobacteriaceae bacterium]|nr:SHOCT domain-containing protein [Acidobacteriaceae bacterium]
MTNLINQTLAAALPLALTAPAAWADSTVTTPAAGGAASFQGPGWSGYGPGPWMMGGWGGGPMMGYGGWGGGGWIMMLFGGVIIVALLVFIFRALAWSTHPPHQNLPHPGHGSAGLHALDERYARGDINREEYVQKKRDILGT